MAIGALTGTLLGVQAASGIASSIMGGNSARRQQRGIQRAHNRYNGQRLSLFNQLADDTAQLSNEANQRQTLFLQALNSEERARQAQERQMEVMGAVADRMAEMDQASPEGRSGAQRTAQKSSSAQQGVETDLLNAIIGAQASQQGRQAFDANANFELMQSLMPLQAQATDLGVIAQSQDMQNRLDLQNRLTQLGVSERNTLGEGLGLLSGVAGTGAMMAGLFGGPGTGAPSNGAGSAVPGAGGIANPNVGIDPGMPSFAPQMFS